MKPIFTALVGMLVLSQSAYSQTRENFTLNGLSAFVIVPNTPAPGKPWIAYAPAVGGLPNWTGSGEEKWMMDQYFAAGIAVAGIYSGDLSGNTVQRAGYTALYTELVDVRGYAAQFSFHTRSRGGLLGYNWAADNPGKVAAIGGIYPVTNLLSYPGFSQATIDSRADLHNPIDRLAPLASSGVKMFHIHGDNDGTVPLNENSQITKDRYDALGGVMTLTVIAGGGHDYNNHWWTNQPLTDFMIAETLAAASTVGPPTLNTLTSVTPTDGATDVLPSSNLVANFSEVIALTGTGTINLKSLSGGADIPVSLPGDVTIVGRTLTINPATNLVGGEEYAVEISSDAIEDIDATPNPYAGLLSTDTPNWSFTAAMPDLTNPTISSMEPTAGESNVSQSPDLILVFSENVQANSGNITIHLASNDSVVETIVVPSSAVTVSGAKVTIDTGNLAANTSYYVKIAAGAFEDLSENPFAGITDKTSWTFTTGDQPLLINPSFETDAVNSGGAVGGSMTGWTAVGAAGNQEFSPGNASQIPKTIFGEQHAYTNGTNASVSQVTPLTITAGETYTLTVDVGQISNFSNSQGTIRLFGNTLGLGTALSNSNGTAELSGITPPNQSTSYLVNQTITYTALASGDPFEGQQLGVILIGSSGIQVLYDNVRLEVIAPNTFANWIDGYDVGALTGFDDDPDGDNLSNGLEAWFGTHPGQFNTGLTNISTNGNITTFTHPQNTTTPDDLTGYYEWSPNLVDWYAGDGADGPPSGPAVTIVPNTTGTTTTVTATVSGEADRIFLRAGVNQN